MNKYLDILNGMSAKAWQLLQDGAASRAQVQLATISTDNWPEVRTVVLRHADTATTTIEIYTDAQSDKITSLKALPRASVHLWDPDHQLQLRLRCDVAILTGPQADAAWQAVPDHARQSYGVIPPPGTRIAQPTAYEKPSLQAQFAILRCTVVGFDMVSLGLPHRRAAFRSQGGEWHGNWLAP